MGVNCTCQRCGIEFTVGWPSHVRPFCGRPCAYAARKKAQVTSQYRMVYAPKHPLRMNSPVIPEHRMILWDKVGPGSHPCHHCGTTVTWTTGGKVRRGTLITDHLDRNKHNNDPANLVPSCGSCNLRNTPYGVQDDEDYRVNADGSRKRCERRTCGFCAEEFLARPDAKRPNRGRFCSRSCARSGPRLKTAS